LVETHKQVIIAYVSYAQQYSFKKGLQKFGKKGSNTVTKELDQQHKRNCFVLVDVFKLTVGEKKKAQHALMLLTEKSDGSVKGHCVYNGKPKQMWLSKEDTLSPTVATESIMLAVVIDVKEGWDMMMANVPNASIQTKMPEMKKNGERVIMKIKGVLVDLMVELAPDIYRPYVVSQVLMVLYAMLAAALLWYKKFKEDLKKIDFKLNSYHACVANRSLKGGQQTVRFHVDDLMSSHKNAKVNDDFAKW
jgi:hypothetical protein